MIRKFALGTALIVGSISGAFAFENIDNPHTYVEVRPASYDAYAAARAPRAALPAWQETKTFDPKGDVVNN